VPSFGKRQRSRFWFFWIALPFLTQVSENQLISPHPGDLDTTFGNNGQVMTFVRDLSHMANHLLLLQNGKFLVAGEILPPRGSQDKQVMLLARYHADGRLDNIFGEGGIVTVAGVGVNAVALQTDGKIVIAGVVPTPFGGTPSIARVNSDGNLDPTFGDNGKVVLYVNNQKTVTEDVVVQQDGMIVVLGNTVGEIKDLVLFRHHSDGSMDASFGEGGRVVTDFNNGKEEFYSIALQPDGKIVVAGGTTNQNNSIGDFALARYHPNGALDPSFGSGGKVTTDFNNGFDRAKTIAIQANGKIIAAGSSGDHFALTQYNTDGSLDRSFGIEGKVVTSDFPYTPNEVFSLALQSNGKIIAVGKMGDASLVQSDQKRHTETAVARYDSNGNLDSDFGVGGKVSLNFYTPSDLDIPLAIPSGVIIQNDGKIVVAGRRYIVFDNYFTLARYIGGDVEEPMFKAVPSQNRPSSGGALRGNPLKRFLETQFPQLRDKRKNPFPYPLKKPL